MGTFAFKALDLAGTSTRGEVEGENKQGVAGALRGKGLIVLDIEEIQPASAGDLLSRFKKVKRRRAHDRHSPAVDNGLVGHVAAALPVRD